MDAQNPGPLSQPIHDCFKPAGAPSDVAAVSLTGGEVPAELGQVAKRKRGRPPKAQAQVQAQAKPPPVKKIKEEEEEEDVCFICFDGGSLVLCDRRGCPKAYHPACIKRDEAFFESAAKWNCGWHICSICQKSAHHMCYTCTFSLCKGCIRKSDYVCVRGDKGFCTICMKTIMLIESNGQGEDGKVQVDFDDKTSWEYLFKVYWVYLKGKLSLTLDELTQAKTPWKVATTIVSPVKSITLETPFENLDENDSKRRKIDEPINTPQKEIEIMEKPVNNGSETTVACDEWATKELLDFISYMKNGDATILSQFDVQALVMEYVNRNNLRDPKKKNQIICDSRLKNLFGKPRIGHIEMMKILEYHFFVQKDSWNSDNKLRKRKSRSKGEERALQNKLDEYAAIDVHNMNLIYLRRNLMENLFEDGDSFNGKVVGSIVRIRISGSDQKDDMYRLVQVVGTSKVDVPYKIGSKLVDVMLEVLNLDKKEIISIDTISDQEFSEEECRRLQQSIRCGLVKHFTVGEVQEKAVALQSVRLNDWMETEISRLNHLRDVASEKGHKKGYRECVEKLQLLKTPEEGQRRLKEIPEVHSDPKMNPDYESDDTEEYFNKEHGEHMESKYSGISRKASRPPKKRAEALNKQPKSPSLEQDESTKDALGLSLGKSQNEPVSNASTVTKSNHQNTLSSSLSNNDPETVASSLSTKNGQVDIEWHYRDPNGKVQGPFSLAQLQRWTGYFPPDMRTWSTREDKSLLLNDVLKEHFHSSDIWRENTTAIPSLSTISAPNSVDHETLPENHGSSLGQSYGQNWSANNTTTTNNNDNNNDNNLDCKPPSVPSSTMSNDGDIKNVSTDMPKNTSQEVKNVESVPPPELLVQDSGNPPSWSSASSLVLGGAKLPGAPANGWPIKREEWDSGLVSVAGDHVATPTSNIEQNIHPCNELPSWNGVGEMIEFSTLAEESVSDLLAEVDAMESQYGLPSPTSRRNSFVDDLFNGSFDEFSPTPDQGTRSDGFSSSGDIQLPCPTDEHQANNNNNNIIAFDLMKTSSGLNLENMGFKWPQMERVPQGMIDINRSAKAETDDGDIQPVQPSESGKQKESGELVQLAAPPLTLGLDQFDPMQDKLNASRSEWDPNQRRYINNSSNNNGQRNYLRPPAKGQRVCKFYESGRCKKGAACKYLHP